MYNYIWQLEQRHSLLHSRRQSTTCPQRRGNKLERLRIRCRTIWTVESAGATSTNNSLDFFLKVVVTKNTNISKKWEEKTPKCIDITLCKWSWWPLWQVGKIFIQPLTLFEGFRIFPGSLRCWLLNLPGKNPQIQSHLAKFGCGSGCIFI